jgi:glycosyltransferase involved in cell wall biosynthesis
MLVPPGDSLAIADAIEQLLKDRTLLRQLGEGARRHVVETHDIVSVTSELARALAGQKVPPPRNISAAA